MSRRRPRRHLDLAGKPELSAVCPLPDRHAEQRAGALLVLPGATADNELRPAVAKTSHNPEVDRPLRASNRCASKSTASTNTTRASSPARRTCEALGGGAPMVYVRAYVDVLRASVTKTTEWGVSDEEDRDHRLWRAGRGRTLRRRAGCRRSRPGRGRLRRARFSDQPGGHLVLPRQLSLAAAIAGDTGRRRRRPGRCRRRRRHAGQARRPRDQYAARELGAAPPRPRPRTRSRSRRVWIWRRRRCCASIRRPRCCCWRTMSR